jgi:NAD(P)-dependent dehydrogenase (short-subunit alcohol dehydrogenase family)
MSDSLAGRVAVVTGAGRGIGRATALILAGRGAKVVVNDLGTTLEGTGESVDTASEVVAKIEAAGGEAAGSRDSVSEWESAQRIIQTALDRFGRIDLLVNNAGITRTAPIWETDPDDFDRIVRSHLYGTFYCIRAAAPHMKEQGFGRIVNLVSRGGLVGIPGNGAYAGGKGGIFGLTNVASRDLAPFGITVNGVNPAATETRMVTTAIDAFRREGGDAATRAEGLVAALQPPEQVASLITALCEDDEGRMNGQFFYVEKGRIGIFQPLEVTRESRTDGEWNVDNVLEALAQLEPHSLGAVYGA